MRHRLEHVQFGVYLRLSKRTVHPYRVGQEQVARARLEESRRKACQVAEQRREMGVRQIGPTGIEFVVCISDLGSTTSII